MPPEDDGKEGVSGCFFVSFSDGTQSLIRESKTIMQPYCLTWMPDQVGHDTEGEALRSEWQECVLRMTVKICGKRVIKSGKNVVYALKLIKSNV